MSWWVYLEDHSSAPWCTYGQPGAEACPRPCYPAVEVTRFREGGTHVLGGSTEAELNVTYNYGGLLQKALGIPFKEALDGHAGREVIELLNQAVHRLGTTPDTDYWAATQGNAGHALNILLAWAREHPDAIFRVS